MSWRCQPGDTKAGCKPIFAAPASPLLAGPEYKPSALFAAGKRRFKVTPIFSLFWALSHALRERSSPEVPSRLVALGGMVQEFEFRLFRCKFCDGWLFYEAVSPDLASSKHPSRPFCNSLPQCLGHRGYHLYIVTNHERPALASRLDRRVIMSKFPDLGIAWPHHPPYHCFAFRDSPEPYRDRLRF